MKRILTAFAAVLVCAAAFAQPWLRENNIEEVIAAMTLEEKASLLVGGGWGNFATSEEVKTIGAVGSTRPIDRLGIPATALTDGPAGVRIPATRPGDDRTYYATGYPVGTSLASTWNVDLVREIASTIGEETKEYGNDVLLAPGMNIHRNPLCGRNFEYFSEDPVLSGRIGAAYVSGVQSNGVGVSVKHFAANNAETNREMSDSRVGTRALREIYLKGFEIAVKESHPWTVMASYNLVNGTFVQQSYDLLTTVLRDEWGFDGMVMTDWGSKEGTVAAVKAGNDLMEPGTEDEVERIVTAVKDGSLDIKDVDRNVRRVLEYIVKTPKFKKYAYSSTPDLESHARLVREAAAEGMVLLKNEDGTLPLSGGGNVALFGLRSYDMIAGGTGSGDVNKPYVRNLADGFRENGFTVDATIEGWYRRYSDFTSYDRTLDKSLMGLIRNYRQIPEPSTPSALVKTNVDGNDIAVVTIGRTAGEGYDRRNESGDWMLSGSEIELLQDVAEAYHAAGKKVIVVLNIDGVIETASWKDIPDAILLAWTPGQEAGYSVADVLTGKSYPSGKLPMTFPEKYFDIPSSANFPNNYNLVEGFLQKAALGGAATSVRNVGFVEYEEGINVGYRYFQTAGKAVSYPFGFGLGYTTFAYGKPSVKVAKDGTLTATVTITNTGRKAGKETVQLYISAPDGGLVKPAFELKAFAKTRELAPGESETLTMRVGSYSLASFNEKTSSWETASGTYTALFGASAADIRCKSTFKEAKAQSWKVHDVLHPAEPAE